MAESQPGRRLMGLALAVGMAFGLSLNAYAFEISYDTEDEDVVTVEEEAPAVVVVTDHPLARMLTEVDLNPRTPQSDALKSYVSDIMDDILDDSMDTYAQLKACYDYLVDTVSYGNHMRYLDTAVSDGVTCRQIYNAYGEVEGFGAVALTAKTGMCNAYASGFILMARQIGLDAYLVKGYTHSRGGGYAYHEWAEINIDGQIYVFDPQLEQDLVKAGLPTYSVFFKTYDQTNGRYSK